MKTLFVIFLVLAQSVQAKVINIICSYEGVVDKSGYTDLLGEFSVRVEESEEGLPVNGWVSDGAGCDYKYFKEYNEQVILFNECKRPAWLSAKDETPQGHLQINRITGSFEQFTMFPSDQSWAKFTGTCQSATKKF